MTVKPDIDNFKNCIADAKMAMLANDFAPQDPTNYSQLRGTIRGIPQSYFLHYIVKESFNHT